MKLNRLPQFDHSRIDENSRIDEKRGYALNPSCIGEPCPTQPKQVKTIPTIEVGKEGLAAFTVWINVNGFPSQKKMNICTNEGPVGGIRPRDLRSM